MPGIILDLSVSAWVESTFEPGSGSSGYLATTKGMDVERPSILGAENKQKYLATRMRPEDIGDTRTAWGSHHSAWSLLLETILDLEILLSF